MRQSTAAVVGLAPHVLSPSPRQHARACARERKIEARVAHQSKSSVQYFHGLALPYLRWHSS